LAWFSCDMLSVFVNLFLGLWSVCLVLLFLIVVVWVLDLLLDRLYATYIGLNLIKLTTPLCEFNRVRWLLLNIFAIVIKL